MPRKITDSLNQGLQGRIYLQAYPEVISGYQLARRIYKVPSTGRSPKPVPPTSRVYTSLKLMKQTGLVDQVAKGFLSRAEPVATRIRERLAATSVPLTEDEEKRTLEILNSMPFRRHMGRTEEFHKCGENAAETIQSELGILACTALVAKRYYPEPGKVLAKEFKEYLEQSSSAIDAVYEEEVKPLLDEEFQKEVEDSLNQHMHSAIPDIFFFVIETEKTILQKFARLLSKEDYLSLKQLTKIFLISVKGKV